MDNYLKLFIGIGYGTGTFVPRYYDDQSMSNIWVSATLVQGIGNVNVSKR